MAPHTDLCTLKRLKGTFGPGGVGGSSIPSGGRGVPCGPSGKVSGSCGGGGRGGGGPSVPSGTTGGVAGTGRVGGAVRVSGIPTQLHPHTPLQMFNIKIRQ